MKTITAIVAALALAFSLTAQQNCNSPCPNPPGVLCAPGTTGCNSFSGGGFAPTLTLRESISNTGNVRDIQWRFGNPPFPAPGGQLFAFTAISIGQEPYPIAIPGTNDIRCQWNVPFDTLHIATNVNFLPVCTDVFFSPYIATLLPSGLQFFAQTTFVDSTNLNSIAVTNPIQITVL